MLFSTGAHRYTFLLFREPSETSYGSNDIGGGNEREQRRRLNAMALANTHNLTLIGATFFLVET